MNNNQVLRQLAAARQRYNLKGYILPRLQRPRGVWPVEMSFLDREHFLSAIGFGVDAMMDWIDEHKRITIKDANMILLVEETTSGNRKFIVLIDVTTHKTLKSTLTNGDLLALHIPKLMPKANSQWTGIVTSEYAFLPPHMVALNVELGRIEAQQLHDSELAGVKGRNELFTVHQLAHYFQKGKKFVGNATVLSGADLRKRYMATVNGWDDRVWWEQINCEGRSFTLVKTLNNEPDELPTILPFRLLPPEELRRVFSKCSSQQDDVLRKLQSGICGTEAYIWAAPGTGGTTLLALIASLYARFDLDPAERVPRDLNGPLKATPKTRPHDGISYAPFDITKKLQQPGFDLQVMPRDNILGIALGANEAVCKSLHIKLLEVVTAVKPYAIILGVVSKDIKNNITGQVSEYSTSRDAFKDGLQDLSILAQKYKTMHLDTTGSHGSTGQAVPADPVSLIMAMIIVSDMPLSADIEAHPSVRMLRKSPLCHHKDQWQLVRSYYLRMSMPEHDGITPDEEEATSYQLRQLRDYCIRCADVLVMTFASAMGSDVLVSARPVFAIVDHAAMASEVELLAIDSGFPSIKTVYHVGDKEQLGPQCPSPADYNSQQPQMLLSGFLRKGGYIRVPDMTTNCRSHQDIAKLYGDLFYNQKIDGLHDLKVCADSVKFGRVASEVFNLNPESVMNTIMVTTKGTNDTECLDSLLNQDSSQVVKCYLKKLLKHYHSDQIGIICPYSAQHDILRTRCAEVMDDQPSTEANKVTVKTIETAQTDVFDVVIFDMTATGSFDFHDQSRRLAVALSRARYGLIIIAETGKLLAAAGGQQIYKDLSRTLQTATIPEYASQVRFSQDQLVALKLTALSTEVQQLVL